LDEPKKYQTDSGQNLLPESFFLDEDVVGHARRLLGKVMVTNIDGHICRARIVETEAYRAPDDQACHAANNRRTPRTEVMFARGGHAYVYLCYGIHHLFNVVTGPEGMAHAVLIRGVEPLDNTAVMLERRQFTQLKPQLTAGPGVLAKAMGITTRLSGVFMPAVDAPVWLEDDGYLLKKNDIRIGTRVGIASAGNDAFRPWRFSISGNRWVSPRLGEGETSW